MTAARAGSVRARGTGLPADSDPLTRVDTPSAADAWLFGWDPLPGIVSVWADRSGRARVWQRTGGGVRCSADRFRPWVFAASLDDVRHLGTSLVAVSEADAAQAPVSCAICSPPATGAPSTARSCTVPHIAWGDPSPACVSCPATTTLLAPSSST